MVFKRTSRGSTVLLLSAVFVTIGLLQTSESSLALVYAGIGLFLYYYSSKLVLQLKIAALNKLKVERKHAGRTPEDKTVNVSVLLANETFMNLRTEVFDSYPEFFRLKNNSNTGLISIPGHGYSRLDYELAPTSIGLQDFGTVHLTVRDLAGLFFYERDITTTGTVEVTPRGKEIARGALAATTVATLAGPLTSRRKGEGMEFADIREYSFGDPFKRIEWKSTARTGQLMVRELHAETQLNVMVLLDAAETMAYGEAGQTKLDYSARAVASLVTYLSRRGDFFGLALVQGQSPARIIPLARGESQTSRVLLELGRLTPTPSGTGRLEDAVRRALTLGSVKGRTLFFVISDLETYGGFSAMKQLIAMSHEVVIVSPYTPLFETHGLRGLDRVIYSIETSHQWRKRKDTVREAAKLGIPMFDVGPRDLFPQLVMRVEEHRRKGGS